MKIKIGQINFINCLPINLPLARLGLGKDFDYEIYSAVPSDLNQKLASAELDLAPISSFEYLRNKDKYHALEGLGISSKIEADSVLFFCDADFWSNPNKVIHVTSKSATSVNLLKILLTELYKFDLSQIRFEVFDLNQKYSAKLLIGDEALQEDKTQYEEVIDLGAKWFELTALPMVFGLWTVNKKSKLYKNPEKLELVNQKFLAFRDIAFKDLHSEMLSEAQRQTGLAQTALEKYFNNLDYSFSNKHQESLDLFESYLSRQLAKIN